MTRIFKKVILRKDLALRLQNFEEVGVCLWGFIFYGQKSFKVMILFFFLFNLASVFIRVSISILQFLVS